jgi:hypothetical protein
MAQEAQVCPSCGADRRPGALFCVSCGTSLGPPSATPETIVPQRSNRRTWLIVGVAVGAVILIMAAVSITLLARSRPAADAGAATTDSGRSALGAEIQTPGGRFAIEDVETVEGFPPGCEPGPACQTAEAGYQILVVWVVPLDGSPGDVSGGFFDESEGVYITDSAGTRSNRFSGGLTSGRLFVGFTPEESSSGFVLHWPGNPPIPLDIS